MADLKAMEARINDNLQKLMKARGWDGGDNSWYMTYRKDGITLEMKVDSTGDYTVTGYQIVFYSYNTYNRRFKVTIDRDSFTIDEKKLDKKIEEVCAILRERDEGYRKREKQVDENEKKAAEFAAEMEELLPRYEVTPSGTNTAEVKLPGGSVFITSNGDDPYSIRLDCALFADISELPGFIKTLADHS